MKRLLPLLGVALLAAAPAAAQEVSIPHTTFQLPNGLRVIVNEDRSTPIATVNVWYHVGSGYEKPGRTGFAHLFEHILFEGSKNVPEGDFDNLLEAAGAVNNGSTTSDRTNYYEILPKNALELALWLEADRMGGLLDAMNEGKLAGQREVVKNERRQRVDNQPYGRLFETAFAALYPAGHPYSWPVIGSLEDLDRATLADVEDFFRTYYAPNNATLAISGDVSAEEVRPLVEKYFGWIPRGPDVAKPDVAVPPIPETRHITLEDRVTLPQLTMVWRGVKSYAPDDAALDALARILTDGKNSRLYKRLVYDQKVAQNVTAFNYAQLLSGDFFVQVTARPDVRLDAMERAVEEEVARLAQTPPTAEELQRVVSQIETEFVRALETTAGKADQLNSYLYYTGDSGYADEDLARYRSLTPADVQRVAREYLAGKNRVVVSIVPEGKTNLAVAAKEND
ncbi:MAG TPA: pitrilysin family protein [Longimicrobiaceae bacterium]|nr:pitrilysin family protein [Longimicrobiaceae bacterium]